MRKIRNFSFDLYSNVYVSVDCKIQRAFHALFSKDDHEKMASWLHSIGIMKLLRPQPRLTLIRDAGWCFVV